jgi:hypothetical protein
MMPCFATGGALIDRSGDLSDLPGIGRERCPPNVNRHGIRTPFSGAGSRSDAD